MSPLLKLRQQVPWLPGKVPSRSSRICRLKKNDHVFAHDFMDQQSGLGSASLCSDLGSPTQLQTSRAGWFKVASLLSGSSHQLSVGRLSSPRWTELLDVVAKGSKDTQAEATKPLEVSCQRSPLSFWPYTIAQRKSQGQSRAKGEEADWTSCREECVHSRTEDLLRPSSQQRVW